jgi:hypothetical protein
MDNFTWPFIDLLSAQAVRERLAELERDRLVREADARRAGLRARVASMLVRLGLRLDPAAGERLRLPAPPALSPEARQRA